MPASKQQIDEIKANVALARKRELNFGLCLGKKPDTTLLLCHKTKAAAALGREAKKSGETNKMTFGKLSVDGKVLNLICEGDIPTGLSRRVRELFKQAGLSFKVMVQDADGTTMESDGEDEDAEAQTEPARSPQSQAPAEDADQAAANPSDPQDEEESVGETAQQWEKVRQEAEELLRRAAVANPVSAKKLEGAWGQISALGKFGDFEKALAKAGKFMPTLERLSGGDTAVGQGPAADPEVEKRKAERMNALKELEARADELLASVA